MVLLLLHYSVLVCLLVCLLPWFGWHRFQHLSSKDDEKAHHKDVIKMAFQRAVKNYTQLVDLQPVFDCLSPDIVSDKSALIAKSLVVMTRFV